MGNERKTIRGFLFLILVALALLYISRFFSWDRAAIQQQFTRFPLVLSGIIFVVVYVVSSTFIWVGPKDVLRLAVVYLYGPYISTVFVTAAEMLNLPIMFLLSRRLGRPFVAERLKGGMKQVDQAIAETGYGMIFFSRLFLLFPLRFLDLGFGLTSISLGKYFLISLLATPLRIFVVQFFWSLGFDTVTDPEKLSAYLSSHPFIFKGVLAYFLGSIVMVWVLKRRARKRRSIDTTSHPK